RREAYLEEACAGEPELRHEVESLLSTSGSAGRRKAADLIENLQNPVIGRRVGKYRVTGEVGRGGMGEVYRAIRDDDHFHQQVAIKIDKRGMDTDFILR